MFARVTRRVEPSEAQKMEDEMKTTTFWHRTWSRMLEIGKHFKEESLESFLRIRVERVDKVCTAACNFIDLG